MARPSPVNVRRLAELLDKGTLRVPLQRLYPLAEAGEALRALATSHTQGKLGIVIT
jgi:NADPH:quinone reductase-like Zn-dependent oxidoreductase